VIGDTERSTKDTRGDSKRSRRHTWTTRRDRRESGGGTERSGIQGEHGNIEKEAKKILTGRFDKTDAKKFTKDTGKSGGGTGRSGMHERY
jgi:hypothetical protein